MFTLAISCLILSNLPWFMDLTFHIPMQYCSLQHQTLFSPPDTSNNWAVFPLWLNLILLSGAISPVFSRSILDTNLGSSSISVIPFYFFMLFMEFSRQEWWSDLPFLSPVDHVLSELSTMTRLSWVALDGMTHSFTELDKVVIHVISLVSFLSLWFSFCLPSNG